MEKIRQALKKDTGCLFLVDPFRLNDDDLIQQLHELGFTSCLFEFPKDFIEKNQTENNVKVKRAKLLIAYYDEKKLLFQLMDLKTKLKQHLNLIEL